MSETRIGVIGLGYVGLPVAVAFSEKYPVVGFDIDSTRIDELESGRDRTREVSSEALRRTSIEFTSDPRELRNVDIFIVAVPTPVDAAHNPDLEALRSASKIVGEAIGAGAIVVFESTVFPGATEEVCVPILEAASGLESGRGFGIGYSPERINPGDTSHPFGSITKVVAAGDDATLAKVEALYASVIDVPVHRASSIRVAETAKVLENTQRDLNIALMNELALICHRLEIDTMEVIEAASTKWNFLPFVPGLVGGHCIGVDPYYLTHKAEEAGYHPDVILAGRRINDGMGNFVADELLVEMSRAGERVRESMVTVLGLSFKENVPDLRNSGVRRMIERLESFGMTVQLHDPVAPADDVRRVLGRENLRIENLAPARAVVLAVAHDTFLDDPWRMIAALLEGGRGIVMDVKGVIPREAPDGVRLWRL